MLKILKYLTFIAIPILLYIVFNQAIVNTYDGRSCVSFSLETSKKNNLYLNSYRPLKDSLTLKDKKLKAINLWTEKRWTDGHFALFFYKIYPYDYGMNVIIPQTTNFDTVDFTIEPPNNNSISNMGGQPDLGFVYSYNFVSDTIKLYVKQRKNDSWEEEIIVDSIDYVKL